MPNNWPGAIRNPLEATVREHRAGQHTTADRVAVADIVQRIHAVVRRVKDLPAVQITVSRDVFERLNAAYIHEQDTYRYVLARNEVIELTVYGKPLRWQGGLLAGTIRVEVEA